MFFKTDDNSRKIRKGSFLSAFPFESGKESVSSRADAKSRFLAPLGMTTICGFPANHEATPSPRLIRRQFLLALLQLDFDFQFFAIAKNSDSNDIADLTAAQSVSEVVKVFDGLVAKLNEDVSRLKAGFCGR
jgi:hypothetical protein